MITKELLHKNVQYVKENKDELNYFDDPLPMFNKDGKFNPLNWNGGMMLSDNCFMILKTVGIGKLKYIKLIK